MKIQYFRHSDAPGEIPIAVRAGDFVFFAGGIAAHPVKGIPDEVKPFPNYPYHGSSIERQLRYVFTQMGSVLEAAGSSNRRIMNLNMHHTNTSEVDTALRLRKDYFGLDEPPPSTQILVPELTVRGASVTCDSIALASDAELDRETYHKDTEKTPLPIHDRIYGHPIFVQAARGGGFIFPAGKTVGVSPDPGAGIAIFGHPDLPYKGIRIKQQTRFILEFYKSLLESMGASLSDVVKANIHKINMQDFASMDEVWREYFPTDPPARTISPTSTGDPNIARIIEIEIIAIDPRGKYHKETIFSSKAPKPFGHEPQAIKAGPYLFISGQLATDYKTGLAPEARVDPDFPYHSSSIKRQVNYILDNVESICQSAGTSSKNLVRRRAMHSDLREIGEAEETWAQRLGDRVPPTTFFKAASPLLVPKCSVIYDLIAFVPQ